MRKLFLSCFAALVGCGGTATSYVHTDTTLGRVVVYRNGVAYFERYANVNGDKLTLDVPGDKVDDFLKSLTVVDAVTGQPAPIAYPTRGGERETANGTVGMDIRLSGVTPHRLKLSYVTESPSWKPSYRVTLGKDGHVGLQAWAIVDNTSGEDWQNVKLGVGSSSAMSFRFDLRSVRVVARETLSAADLFAVAPPNGESTFGGDRSKPWASGPGDGHGGVDLSDTALADSVAFLQAPPAAPPPPAPTVASATKSAAAHARARALSSSAFSAPPVAVAPPPESRPNDPQRERLRAFASNLRGGSQQVTVEGYASSADADKSGASLARANQARDELVRAGVDASRIKVVAKGEEAGRSAGVHIVAEDKEKDDARGALAQGKGGDVRSPTADASAEPIGTSHFETGAAMTVPHGSSAMVSILHSDTEGEVVYLYDPETARGNSAFPFRAVHIKNPTDSALESGPVTVFGDGKFIGEGMCDPIPARSTAFVPFALDRQIVVERKDGERDEIARVLTVQRGVLSTEVKHVRRQTLSIHNRMGERATVYLRHTVAPGYALVKSPALSEHMGSADVFRVELSPGAKVDVDLEEATPVQRSTDLRTPEGLDMVRAFVSSAAADGPLRPKLAELLQVHKETMTIQERIQTTRDQMQEYRERMDELHRQILTLKMVKTGGPLMQSLEKKMQEVSDKLSKATIDVVAYEEQLMVARVRFQDKVADLTMEKDDAKQAAAASL